MSSTRLGSAGGGNPCARRKGLHRDPVHVPRVGEAGARERTWRKPLRPKERPDAGVPRGALRGEEAHLRHEPRPRLREVPEGKALTEGAGSSCGGRLASCVTPFIASAARARPGPAPPPRSPCSRVPFRARHARRRAGPLAPGPRPARSGSTESRVAERAARSAAPCSQRGVWSGSVPTHNSGRSGRWSSS